VRGVILALRFLLELCLLAAFAWGGWNLAGGGFVGVLVAAFEVVVLAVIWGLWIAPRSRRRLADPARFVLEVVLFVVGGWSLWVAWTPVAGIVLAVASIVVAALTRVVGETVEMRGFAL
jgi:uncharacterized protein DUF2568